ncbi:MAG: endoribonuclease MazF [Sulfuricaulis sp.]|uniref:endoribonuclease MazF n=1 Tax=Sulfuricaulis sp. TaxID=2003553 RepID=UPI0025FADFCA|nr:endoribonuclease MazF [Sulfuricaulis sp.]MCR4347324.1 endoribonuclease MazF [Sulfuricaulis sp.]
MSRPRYVPDRGDVVWIDFNPTKGHEQAGHRPALVLSPRSYNDIWGLFVCCPITSKVKGYPFEVPVLGSPDIAGVVLADQVKNLDWRARRVVKKGRAPDRTVLQTLGKLRALLDWRGGE